MHGQVYILLLSESNLSDSIYRLQYKCTVRKVKTLVNVHKRVLTCSEKLGHSSVLSTSAAGMIHPVRALITSG